MGPDMLLKADADVIEWAHCCPEKFCQLHWMGPDMFPKDAEK
jgi:hypothetical protein